MKTDVLNEILKYNFMYLMFHGKARLNLFVRPFRGIHFTTLIQLVPGKQCSQSQNYIFISFFNRFKFLVTVYYANILLRNWPIFVFMEEKDC